MSTDEEAQAAVDKLNGMDMDGRARGESSPSENRPTPRRIWRTTRFRLERRILIFEHEEPRRCGAFWFSKNLSE